MAEKRVAIILLISMIVELFANPYKTAPPDCKKLGICDKVSDYPTELAKELIAELKAKNVKFHDDLKLHPSDPMTMENLRNNFYIDPMIMANEGPHYYFDPMTMENRFLLSNPIQVCPSKVEFKALKHARDMNNVQRFILNDDDDPVQIVRIETCENTTCAKEIQFHEEIESECVQMWTPRKLLTITENGTSASLEVNIPTCCSCAYKYKH